ncbi:addiction module antidote protein [Methylorubrum rhodesianum]|jgi:probable addiction module antidote protein|uniref:Addiction module antidote protein n=1 Tax=Methylorubrum rhodesianum TaxID=29427 RepID=A0ABU9ZGD7_9HYPH|nr:MULTISPECIES: addiction module antidote protein [Methylorubrum]MBB5765642.1 putative addiction module antidote protein [Methylorubrum rhodesianum]MBI1691851.1 putative addiction module antidote protein [Methylorubrum sp. DB1722]MBK3404278.1 putative addiction module antidote protein [Methylorubrum rhodesianum]MBY0143790.1 putative addiction module antidote protein [Methylorubrum populi]
MTDPDRPAEGLAKEPARTPTKPFDPAHYIRTPEDAAAYLTEVLEDGDEAEFRRALGAIARSRSMAEVAERAGLGRESLYKALSETGNPGLSTVLGVLRALDLRMTVAVVRTRPEAA